MGEQTHVRVLLVDDEPHLVLGLSLILRRAGYCVNIATNGADALAGIISRHRLAQPFDILLFDVHMAEMNGIDLLSELERQAIRMCLVPMTGMPDDATMDALSKHRCNRPLVKPLVETEVLKTVAESYADFMRSGQWKSIAP